MHINGWVLVALGWSPGDVLAAPEASCRVRASAINWRVWMSKVTVRHKGRFGSNGKVIT